MPTKSQVLQIPLKGGSGHAPSGPVQFLKDWPGLFIRGDHAIALAQSIRHVEKTLSSDNSPQTVDALKRLNWIARVVDEHVDIHSRP